MTRHQQSARILAIDDTPSNLSTLGVALGDEFDFQFATSGAAGLALAKEDPPDLILLDIMMPEMDGLEVLRRLRKSPWGVKLPVILVTADDRVEVQVEGLQLGADDFVAKPVQMPALRARVRNILARYRLEREQAELVAKLKAANREMARLAEQNALLLESAGAGICSVDQEGRCTSLNPAAQKTLGYAPEELLGKDLCTVLCGTGEGDACRAKCPVCETLRDGKLRMSDETFKSKAGVAVPVRLVVSALAKDGVSVGAELVFEDISERQRMERELFRLATTDTLTGLNNRRRFFELGDAELARVARYNTTASVLMMDLDHFKRINDHHGHNAGDVALCGFAKAMSERLRAADVMGRIGGEEFAILLPETDSAGAMVFAERLRRAVEELVIEAGGVRIPLTVSIGVTELRQGDRPLDAALARADRALYRAKNAGRNRVVLAGPDDDGTF